MVRALVVGLGNGLRTDDGVGLHVARAVREQLGPDSGVEVVELWAGGLRLAEAMIGFDRAVVVDAMTSGDAPPGFVRRVGLEELGGLRSVSCVHDATLPTALELFRRSGEKMPEDLCVIGVKASDTDTLGEELTPALRSAVPVAVEAVFESLRQSAMARGCP